MSSKEPEDTSTEEKPFRPKIAESEVFKFWQDCQKLNFGDTGDYCRGCPETAGPFITGDIIILFGDLDNAPSKVESYCRFCAFREFEKRKPSAAAVYVETAHKDSDYNDLPDPMKETILESMARLTLLFEAIEKLGRENRAN